MKLRSALRAAIEMWPTANAQVPVNSGIVGFLTAEPVFSVPSVAGGPERQAVVEKRQIPFAVSLTGYLRMVMLSFHGNQPQLPHLDCGGTTSWECRVGVFASDGLSPRKPQPLVVVFGNSRLRDKH